MPRKTKSKGKNAGGEYRFKIGAFSPTKIPMNRLAEYMEQLALILGETEHVHFGSLARGSTVIVAKIEHEAQPKVRDRVAQVKRGDGPADARRAYAATNRMLREDNADGSLKGGAVILPFPGRKASQEQFAVVRQQGFVDGRIVSVGGQDKTAHVILMVEDAAVAGFYTSRAIAKQLAKKWDEQVRLLGRGKWSRDAEGNWSLIDFRIESFEPLEEASFSTALERLRAIPTEWSDDAYAELEAIRHGGSKANGGS